MHTWFYVQLDQKILVLPGPPNKGLPFFGHLKLLYKKPAGFAKSWQNLKEMRSEYCTKEDKLLRLVFSTKID